MCLIISILAVEKDSGGYRISRVLKEMKKVLGILYESKNKGGRDYV